MLPMKREIQAFLKIGILQPRRLPNTPLEPTAEKRGGSAADRSADSLLLLSTNG